MKAKDSEILATPLCLGNISKYWPVDNMKKKKKKTGLNGFVYDFSVDYDAIAVGDILDIHKYHKMFRFFKGCFYRISIFIDFNKREFVELYFNEQSRIQNKTTNCEN